MTQNNLYIAVKFNAEDDHNQDFILALASFTPEELEAYKHNAEVMKQIRGEVVLKLNLKNFDFIRKEYMSYGDITAESINTVVNKAESNFITLPKELYEELNQASASKDLYSAGTEITKERKIRAYGRYDQYGYEVDLTTLDINLDKLN